MPRPFWRGTTLRFELGVCVRLSTGDAQAKALPFEIREAHVCICSVHRSLVARVLCGHARTGCPSVHSHLLLLLLLLYLALLLSDHLLQLLCDGSPAAASGTSQALAVA